MSDDIQLLTIYLNLYKIELDFINKLYESRPRKFIREDLKVDIMKFKVELDNLNNQLDKIENKVSNQKKEEISRMKKYSINLKKFLDNDTFTYDVSYFDIIKTIKDDIKQTNKLKEELTTINKSTPGIKRIAFSTSLKLKNINNKRPIQLKPELQINPVYDIDCSIFDELSVADKQKCIKNQLNKFNSDIYKYLVDTTTDVTSKSSTLIMSKYSKLKRSFDRRYNYYTEKYTKLTDKSKSWHPLIRNNPKHNGELLYSLLDDKQKQDFIKCLCLQKIQDIIDDNERGTNTEDVQVVYFEDNLNKFDSKTQYMIKSKTESYLDKLKKTFAEDVEEYKTYEAKDKDFWGMLNDKYGKLLRDGLSDEQMKKEFKHMQDDIDKSPEDDPIRVLKRTGDRRETCQEPFYWAPETVKYKRDKDGKETKELNPLYKKFIKDKNFFCNEYNNDKIPYEVLLPLTFGNIYDINSSKRQLVLKRFSKKKMFDIITCLPEYFISSSQTAYSEYKIKSDVMTLGNNKEQIIYLLSWSIIYNYLLIQCSTNIKSKNNTIFPVRLIIDKTLKNSNYFSYFENIYNPIFIGILTLKIPTNSKNIKNYTVFLLLFIKKDNLNIYRLYIYNFDGDEVDIQSGLYLPSRRVFWKEFYYIKEKLKYNFYEWVEDIPNKCEYYECNKNTENNENIIMGSPYNKKEILEMYQKELEDLKRLSLNKNIREIQEKLDETCHLNNYKKKIEDLIKNPDKYFKKINLKSGKKSIIEYQTFNLQLGGNINYYPFEIYGSIKKIKNNREYLKNILNKFYLNFIFKLQLKENIKKSKLINKTYNNKIIKYYKLYISKNEPIIQNNELFQFRTPFIYWIILYNFLNNKHKNIYWISKNYIIPKLIKYYSKVFNLNLNLTFQVPEYEFLKKEIFDISFYNKNNIIKHPNDIITGDYDFIFLEFFKIEYKINDNDRNPYHIFITILYTLYELVPSIQNKANCIIYTIYINGFFPLVILDLFFKCFEKVEFVEISKLNVFPQFMSTVPIKLYNFKKEKTEWFLKKCKELMDKYPFEYSGNPKEHAIPKYSKTLEKKIIQYNYNEYKLYYDSLLKLENDINLGLINEENNLRDAILLCQKYELPLKKWVPTKAFGEDEYGMHLLSHMFSLDNNIIFQFKSENSNVNKISKEVFKEMYSKLLHKIDLVSLPIEYVDMYEWWKSNRTIRWYAQSLGIHLKEKYNISINHRFVSRGWLKMFEILKLFKFDSKNDTVKTFHVCEAPGLMMMAMKYYITRILKKKHTWKAQSSTETDIFDEFKLIERMRESWNFGPSKTGDITDIKNILYYKQKYQNTGIEWFSGDCGIPFEEKDKTLRLHFAEVLSMMSVLSNGGNFVGKLFFPLVDDTLISLLYIIYKQFDEFYFYKSYQNSWNLEVFVIGKGYKYDEKLVNELIDVYKNNKELNKVSMKFNLQLLNFTEKLYDIHSESINRNLYYMDHIHDLPHDLLKSRIKDRNEDWDKMFMS